MNSKFLILNNSIHKKFLSKTISSKLNQKFEKIFEAIKKDVKNSRKTLNVLDNNLHFDFKTKDLKKFKKFKEIAIIGMGGSILGSGYLRFKKKIKKYFFLMTQ